MRNPFHSPPMWLATVAVAVLGSVTATSPAFAGPVGKPALALGDGGFTARQLVSSDFGVTQGWRVDQHPRFLADINGDGLADIVGFAPEGTWPAVAVGSGGFTQRQLASSAFGVTQVWRVDQHPRLLAVLTGAARPASVGFAGPVAWPALALGDGGFTERQLVSSDFGVTQGWRVDQHPRFLADINGDGLADIVGFGLEGTWTALAQRNGR